MIELIKFRLFVVLGAVAALIGVAMEIAELLFGCRPGSVSSVLISIGVATVIAADLQSRRR